MLRQPRAVALASWLSKGLGVPAGKIARLLGQLGLRITPGGVVQAVARAGRACRPTYQALAQGVRASPVVAPDETGWRVHVPRPLKERALRVCRAGDELHQLLGRAPTTTWLSGQLGMGEDEVLEGSAAMSSRMECHLIGSSASTVLVVSAI
jgi:Transposase IS66 family